MSAKGSDVVVNVAPAAVGMGNRPVFDPLAGFPHPPFFNRKLQFFSGCDTKGRIRLYAMTIHEEQ